MLLTTAADLERSARAILPLFDATGPGLDRSYAPGKWTARQVLLHIADTESVVHDRLRRVLAGDRRPLTPFTPDRWAAELTARRSLATAKRLFAVNREAIVELAAGLRPADYGRTGWHLDRGETSVAALLRMVRWHGEHHGAQARTALG